MVDKIIQKDYPQGIIEVEGSEEFVSKELNKFWKNQNADKRGSKHHE